MLEVMNCGELFQTAGAAWKTLFQWTQVWSNLAVGDSSHWIEGGAEVYETGSIQTDSSVPVLLAP